MLEYTRDLYSRVWIRAPRQAILLLCISITNLCLRPRYISLNFVIIGNRARQENKLAK